MKIQSKFYSVVVVIIIAAATIFSSCKKEEDKHTPPDMSLKSGGSYVSSDTTVAQSDSILVGVEADKTEDELKTFNVSVAYDGATTTTSVYDYTLTASEEEHFEQDVGLSPVACQTARNTPSQLTIVMEIFHRSRLRLQYSNLHCFSVGAG